MHNKLLNSALTLINIYPNREEKWMVYVCNVHECKLSFLTTRI